MKKTPIYKRSNGLEQSLESYTNCWCRCYGGACGCNCHCFGSGSNVFYNNQGAPQDSQSSSMQQVAYRSNNSNTSHGW